MRARETREREGESDSARERPKLISKGNAFSCCMTIGAEFSFKKCIICNLKLELIVYINIAVVHGAKARTAYNEWKNKKKINVIYMFWKHRLHAYIYIYTYHNYFKCYLAVSVSTAH